jgi:hypothetical protein
MTSAIAGDSIGWIDDFDYSSVPATPTAVNGIFRNSSQSQQQRCSRMIVSLLGYHKIVVGVCASIAGDSSFTVTVQEPKRIAQGRFSPFYSLSNVPNIKSNE